MATSIFSELGRQVRYWRAKRQMTQPALAQRLGRDRARISELERDLVGNRWGRDRLTLFADICDAMDLVPILVPRGQAETFRLQIEGAPENDARKPVRSAFDDLFVDLDTDEEEER